MRTQFDHSVRVVSLDNLHAMCERISGMAHRYSVSKVSRSRVHVEYSNPDEYGHERPITAIYPCYPSAFDDAGDNPAVILDTLRVSDPEKTWDGEAWQCFEVLRECPVLWRGMLHDNSYAEWHSHGNVLSVRLREGYYDNPYANVDDVETCELAHGPHCDAPMRASVALCTFTRALAGWCACNAQLRAINRHEETCPERSR